MITSIALGGQIILSFTFRDLAGALTDPSAANLELVAPDGTVTVHPLSDAAHLSLGVYELTVTPNALGRWLYRGVGTGNLIASSLPKPFYVV